MQTKSIFCLKSHSFVWKYTSPFFKKIRWPSGQGAMTRNLIEAMSPGPLFTAFMDLVVFF